MYTRTHPYSAHEDTQKIITFPAARQTQQEDRAIAAAVSESGIHSLCALYVHVCLYVIIFIFAHCSIGGHRYVYTHNDYNSMHTQQLITSISMRAKTEPFGDNADGDNDGCAVPVGGWHR